MFLFTGENRYQMSEERNRWIAEFSRKHGSENIIRLVATGLTLRSLLDEVSVAPFLAEKRLVIVDGYPSFSPEQLDVLEQNLHPQVLLLFIDTRSDRRVGGKELLRRSTVKEFPLLKGKALEQFVHATLAVRGCTIAPNAFRLLFDLLGEEQELFALELQKLSLAASVHGNTITVQDVECLVIPAEGVLWRVTDALASGKPEASLLMLHHLLRRGAEAYALWNVVLGFVKNTCAVLAAVQSGERNQRAVAEATGVHPFVVRSLLPYAERLDLDRFRRFHSRALAADTALKTGAHRATTEAPEELVGLLQELLLTAPS
jgi:DNA polymerase III delta subunit